MGELNAEAWDIALCAIYGKKLHKGQRTVNVTGNREKALMSLGDAVRKSHRDFDLMIGIWLVVNQGAFGHDTLCQLLANPAEAEKWRATQPGAHYPRRMDGVQQGAAQ